jgi:NADH-quinone oxidoreductase subunit M
MILAALLLIPLIAGFLAWPAARWHPLLPRAISVVALGMDLVLTVPLLVSGNTLPSALGRAWLASVDLAWIPSLGMRFHLALDGLSWLLIVLTLALGIISVAVSWREITERVGFFHANLLWSLAGTIGVFLALDLFLFFYFWELMLVPMYFIIAIWGHERRRQAAIKFFLFTQGSGLLMLVAILALAFLNLGTTGRLSFDYESLRALQPGGTFGMLILLGFAIAFLVKLAAFPFHTWLPETHTQAPTAGSVILASILLKTGSYGLMRFVMPLFGVAAHQIAPTALWLGAASIIYGAILAYGQSDLKRLVAYSSISHMGFVLIGVFAFNTLAWQGVVILMIAHGISTGALFIVVGSIQKRLHARDLGRMGGLWADTPQLSAFGAFFVIAAMGLPGLGNFVGEFLILRGTYAVDPAVAAVAAIGLIPTALYSLIAIQRAFHGPANPTRVIVDFDPRETAIMATLAAAIIWLGAFPQPVLEAAAPALAGLMAKKTAPLVGQIAAPERLTTRRDGI